MRFPLPLTTLLALLASLSAGAVEDSDRVAIYQQFRSAFDARDYARAQPLAEQLVRLTEQQYGANDLALVNPLVNLGTTKYRLSQFDSALDGYRRSIEILEARSEKTDRQFIRALHGLGATYHALQRDDEAVTALKRAVDLSRNLDGLFNPEQLVVLRPLITSYRALDRIEEAGKEEQYAFTIAETAFGREDRRLLPALDQYARYFESVGRYTTARSVHARAVALGEKVGGRGSVLSIDGLRGVARTYRLAFLYGEEDPEAQPSNQPTGVTGSMLLPSSVIRGGGPNVEGERALKLALQVLAANKSNPDYATLGATLVDLGDWYLTAGAGDRALGAYRDAWKNLSKGGSTALLDKPVALVYRPPAAATPRRQEDAEEFDSHAVKLRFTVTREGDPQDVVADGGTATESQTRSVITALKKAHYRPRLENGEPVATTGMTFETRVYTRRKEEKA
jgi:tetratricopeptide (TPR) repeat protein